MARKLQIANLETCEARSRLRLCHEPYLQELNQRCYLAYYKGGDMRIWIARFVKKKGQSADCRIGLADDFEEADGVRVLNFKQAEMAARNWYIEQAIEEAGAPIDDSPFNKVGAACNRI